MAEPTTRARSQGRPGFAGRPRRETGAPPARLVPARPAPRPEPSLARGRAASGASCAALACSADPDNLGRSASRRPGILPS